MLLQDPFSTVTPTVDGAILQVLAGAHAPFTVANIHALRPDASMSGIRRAIPRLVKQGIVIEHRFDRALAFSLNRHHLAAEGVLALAGMRDTFIRNLRRVIDAWAHPPHLAALFGSAARGDMHLDSDIDILLVAGADVSAIGPGEDSPASPRAGWEAQTADLSDLVTDWTGNHCQIVEMDHPEFVAKVAAADPLLRNVHEDGITLFGDLRQLGAKA